MRKTAGDAYDEERIASISSQLASTIDAATFGHRSWDEVTETLSRAFPGSWTAIDNVRSADPSESIFSSFNLDPYFIQTYIEHFAFANPWNDKFWSRARSGVVAISEDVAPARTFAKSEFYNDWLAPQGVEAAAGVKLDGDDGDFIKFFMHFPLSHAEAYGPACAEVMARTRGNLLRAIDVARLLRRSAEDATASAALVERGWCAAFVVDGTRSVLDANQQAVDLFALGRPLALKHGRVSLSGNDADDRFGKAISALSRGVPVDGSRVSFRDAESAWQVTLAGLPVQPPPAGSLSLLPTRRLVLVLVANLSADAKTAGDLSALTVAFRLTRAEVSFCRQMLLGDSVADAADHLGITVETARTRLKTIFHKTGTSRQGQLMLLLSQLS
jgi:DNA-binding CsgD family transcriptional regulator